MISRAGSSVIVFAAVGRGRSRGRGGPGLTGDSTRASVARQKKPQSLVRRKLCDPLSQLKKDTAQVDVESSGAL